MGAHDPEPMHSLHDNSLHCPLCQHKGGLWWSLGDVYWSSHCISLVGWCLFCGWCVCSLIDIDIWIKGLHILCLFHKSKYMSLLQISLSSIIHSSFPMSLTNQLGYCHCLWVHGTLKYFSFHTKWIPNIKLLVYLLGDFSCTTVFQGNLCLELWFSHSFSANTKITYQPLRELITERHSPPSAVYKWPSTLP